MTKYDIKIVQSETFDKSVTFEKLDGSSVDLSGMTAQAQVRPEPGSATLIKTMTCTVLSDNVSVRMYLSASDTDDITPGVYAYDLALISGDVVRYYLGGTFTVLAHVTEVTE